MKHVLLLAVFALGCSSSDEDEGYKFDRGDVESALVGKWTGSFASGRSGTLEVNLALATPTAQAKCGSRTLSMKCMDTTQATLSGTLTTSDGQLSAVPVTGDLTIIGLTFTNGMLQLQTTTGLTLSATYDNGTLKNGTLSSSSSTASFTLTRAK